jgi:hypothetical protein
MGRFFLLVPSSKKKKNEGPTPLEDGKENPIKTNLNLEILPKNKILDHIYAHNIIKYYAY